MSESDTAEVYADVESKALARFREALDLHEKEAISADKFKAARLAMGIYSQRQQGLYMIRTKIAAGALTPEMMDTLANTADQYSDGIVHLTTRQDAQLYQVTEKNLFDAVKSLHDGGVISIGAGGNSVRNINVCDHGGQKLEEIFNPTSLVSAVSEYLLEQDESSGLPRKVKISFCGAEAGCGSALIDDIAFIATSQNGEAGFKVYVGGGQGAMPRLAQKLMEYVSPKDVHRVVLGILRLFNRRGSRVNRNRARIKFLLEKIGIDKFREFFEAEYSSLETDSLPFDSTVLKTYDSNATYENLTIRPTTGDLSSGQLRELATIARQLGEATFTISKAGDLVISDVSPDHAKQLRNNIANIGLDIGDPDGYTDIVSCNGAATCNEGITNSKGLAMRLESHYKDKSNNGLKLKVSVSGCPNACGHHHTADIGLQGSAKNISGRLVPHYTIYMGGSAGANPGFGKPITKVPAKNVIEAVDHIFLLIGQELSGGETVSALLERLGSEWFEEKLDQFKNISSYEDASDAYLDWDSSKEFSLEEVGPGECAGSALDIIDGYFDQARHDIARAKAAKDDLGAALDYSKNSVVLAAKALLVTYGIDPETDDETLREFDSRIITRGFVPESFRQLLQNGDSKDTSSIDSRLKQSEGFLEECLAAYTRINAKANVEDENSQTGKDDTQEQERLDLSGVACPFNYIKVKLALETKPSGTRLEVLLDDGSPIHNVPKSLLNDGHIIASKDAVGSQFLLVVEKG